MLRIRLVARLVSPIVAVAMMLPSAAGAQEALAQPVPGQTPAAPAPTVITAPSDPGNQSQSQAPGTQTQVTPGGPQTQSQQLQLPGGPAPLNPGSINMQPQIQVLVQPQIQVSAQPHGDASPQANANADVKTNTNTDTSPTITTSDTVHAAPVTARPYTGPTYVPPPRVVTRVVVSQPPPPPKLQPLPRRKGLMITGWIVFGVSYLLTASNAADLYDRCPGMSNPGRCRALARDMFIPVAGPFMAMEHTKYATDDYSLAVAGAMQGAGALMGIIGTGMFIRDGRRNRIINEYGLRVSKNTRINAGGTGMGGSLMLRGQF